MFKFGKWETLLGYELIDSPYNNHVTQGILFTWAIPLVHNGLLASGNLNENIGWAIGVTNGFNNVTDTGDNKGVTGQLSFKDGPFFVSASAFVGSEELRQSGVNGNEPEFTNRGYDNQYVQIYDLVATYDPSAELHLWANADYGRLSRSSRSFPDGDNVFGEATNSTPRWWGLASGFRYAVNEKVSFAARGEYMMDDGGSRFSSALQGPRSSTRLITGTATLGYSLTSNLTARLEYRHDHISGKGGRPFPEHGDGYCTDGGCSSDINVGIVEVNYQFD